MKASKADLAALLRQAADMLDAKPQKPPKSNPRQGRAFGSGRLPPAKTELEQVQRDFYYMRLTSGRD